MNNTTTITQLTVEIWFIVVDTMNILFSCLSILLSILFLMLVAIRPAFQTVPIMLSAYSAFCLLLAGISALAIAIFSLSNDLQAIEYVDRFCEFRGYFGLVGGSVQNYSYLLQALYRYFNIMYPHNTTLVAPRTQFCLIIKALILSWACVLPVYFSHAITYDVYNQVCQPPFVFSFITIYNAAVINLIPVYATVIIYIKVILHVRYLNKQTTAINLQVRAKRELKLLRRVIILTITIMTLGLPYVMFLFISFFQAPPKYHLRISFIFIYVSIFLIMLELIKFTDPVLDVILEFIHRLRRVYPANAMNSIQPRF